MYLSSSILSLIDWEKEDKDFAFCVGDTQFKCNHIQAYSLFPDLQLMRCADASMNSYHLKNDYNPEALEMILNLTFGKPLSFDKKWQLQLFSIACEFHNSDIAQMILPSQSITIENALQYADIKANALLNIQVESGFIASHFFEFHEDKLLNISPMLLESVLTSQALKIANENALYFFIKKYTNHHADTQHLLQYIYPDYLDIKNIPNYLNDIEYYQLYESAWKSLSRRMMIDVKPILSGHNINESKNSNIAQKSMITYKTFDYPYQNSQYLYGFFNAYETKYQPDWSNGTIVHITASSFAKNNHPHNIVTREDSRWMSEPLKNSWIMFNFKIGFFNLTSYTFRSQVGPKSWKIEGSNDGIQFKMLDQRIVPSDFTRGAFAQHHYLLHENNREAFKYIRITQGDAGGHYGNHVFRLERIEFFGKLLVPEAQKS